MHFWKFLPIFAILALSWMSCSADQLAAIADKDPRPQYTFSYSVNDPLTGDVKAHTEERDGSVVRGEYSLNDADGYRRTVQYFADANNGFQAIVRRVPLNSGATELPIAYLQPERAYLAAPTPFHLPYQ